MIEREETAVAVTELLPPGIYPLWSPYDAYEAADALMKALTVEQDEQSRDKTIEGVPTDTSGLKSGTVMLLEDR